MKFYVVIVNKTTKKFCIETVTCLEKLENSDNCIAHGECVHVRCAIQMNTFNLTFTIFTVYSFLLS